MTYLEAAMDIIEMYNEYAIKCAVKGTSCGNHSEAVAIAVEALSIVASMNPPPKEEKPNNWTTGDASTTYERSPNHDY